MIIVNLLTDRSNIHFINLNFLYK